METLQKQLESMIAAQAGQEINQDKVAEFAAKLDQILVKPGQDPDKTKTASE